MRPYRIRLLTASSVYGTWYVMPAYFEHTRRSIRLPSFDYATPGAYFVTVCTYQRECLFGKIVNEKMRVNEIGKIVEEEWFKTEEVRREIALDEYVIMPNHFHGIVWIRPPVGAHGYVPTTHDRTTRSHDDTSGADRYAGICRHTNTHRHTWAHRYTGAHNHAPLPRTPKSLSTWVTGFKWATTTHINQYRNTPGLKVWQRNYYERVIRSDAELDAVRKYIRDNPRKWDEDPERK